MKTLLFLFLFLPFITFSQTQEKASKLSNKASDLFENGNFKKKLLPGLCPYGHYKTVFTTIANLIFIKLHFLNQPLYRYSSKPQWPCQKYATYHW